MTFRIVGALFVALACVAPAHAQEIPSDYAAVLKTLRKTGDFKGSVLKANIPRNDLTVTIGGTTVPIPLGFGGWIAMTKGEHGMDVMMGDLVLTESEVNPVMSAVLNAGLDVTALHNHFFKEVPRIYYLHVHGMGKAEELAKKIRPAIDLIGRDPFPPPAIAGPELPTGLASAPLSTIIGYPGEQNGAVYKITIGRADLDVREHGARIEARMGLNTWAAFAGSNQDAVVAGDVAMLAAEVTPVLKALRGAGLEIVAIHNHMTTGQTIYFLHYWGRGPADKLASGVRAALDVIEKKN
ncbi:MAG TPA: DUF1259 domain-containing protein [Vicinamibacterales bacterium]|nr:DUF1259 domain-containing protein [Vicinamibacterales bacterium]